MNSLIPEFIHRQLDRGRDRGDLSAVCLSLDLSGFTAITEDLMEQGKEGAEELSRIINSLFGAIVETIYSYQGYITSFAGDSLTALFPIEDPRYVCAAAAGARDMLAAQPRLETRFGRYRISARLGIGAGSVQWGIVGTETARTYYFSGDAIDRAVLAQQTSMNGNVVIGRELAQSLERRATHVETGPDESFLLPETSQLPTVGRIAPAAPRLSEAELLSMFPREAVLWSGPGEFRRVAVVFLFLRSFPEHARLNEVASEVRTASDQFGGYFNVLDYGDKGLVMLVLFGAPVAHENDTDRAADFALTVIEGLGTEARCGMATGVVYAGLVGSAVRSTYTALGATVNLAARLAQKTAWGAICTTEQTCRLLGERYLTVASESLRLKGIERPVQGFTIHRAEVTARSGAAGRAVFAGSLIDRSTELDTVTQSVDSAISGRRGGVTYLYGEAGMGKSRLIHTAVQTLAGKARIFAMQADPVLRKSLNPFAGLLAEYFGLDEAAGDRTVLFEQRYGEFLDAIGGPHPSGERQREIERLERFRAFIGAQLGIHIAGSIYSELDPQARFENTIYAITEFFVCHCLLSPVVIVMEDAHALDDDSQTLFLYLTRNLTGLAARLLVSSRYGDDGGKPTLHPPEVTAITEVAVGPLSEEQTGDLFAARVGGPVSERTLDFVYEKTQGNPFYVEQFSGYLVDAGHLQFDGGQYKLSGAIQEIPTGINGILVARLDRLSPELKSVTQVASVFGRQFPGGVVRGIMTSAALETNMDREVADTCLAQGCRQRLWNQSGEDSYTFESTLLRDTAYEMQSSERVRRLHRVAAYALEEKLFNDETQFVDLAYQFEHGEVNGKSAYYLRKAAEAAAASYQNEEAVELYRRLLAIVDPHEQIDVELRIADVKEVKGDWRGAIEDLEKGLEIARSLVRKRQEVNLMVKLGEINQKRGDYTKAEKVLRLAAEQARGLEDPQHYGRSLLYLGRTFWSTGSFDKGITVLETAVAVLGAIEDRDGEALALYYMGVIYRDTNDYSRANEYYRQSETLFRELGNERLETYPLYDLAIIYLYRGELQASFDTFSRVERIYREMGYKSGLAAVLGNLGVISANQGDFHRADSYGVEALDIVQEIGEQLAIAYATFNLGLFLYLRGHHEEAVGTFTRALRTMREIGAEGYYGYVESYISCSFANLGRYEESLQHSLNHLERMGKTGSDVENGRTHLAVALVLARNPETSGGRAAGDGSLSSVAISLLAKIGEITGLAPRPELYFEASIERATKASYIATLIAAYAEYGTYLLQGGSAEDRRRGRSCLLAAQGIAERTTVRYVLPRIEELLTST